VASARLVPAAEQTGYTDLPGPSKARMACRPWITAPPARTAAATNTVSASSSYVAPASLARALCLSMHR
jgi:hypothetical protein